MSKRLSGDELMRIKAIFMPYAFAQRDALLKRNGTFAYYTSADTAAKIIQYKQIWMRNASTMNDYSEIDYGRECLRYARESLSLGERFKAALNMCFVGLAEEVEQAFKYFSTTIREETYITCISEHAPPPAHSEEYFGRLSMWRAYGGSSGVALILRNNTIVGTGNVALGAFSSPVGYFTPQQMAEELAQVIRNIEGSLQLLQSIDRSQLKDIALIALIFGVLATKHPAFSEEREWRVISAPRLFGDGTLLDDIVTVRETVQRIRKIELKNDPNNNLSGLALTDILEKVIIGPTNYPRVVRDSFITLLQKAGFADAENRVIQSDVPLRHIL